MNPRVRKRRDTYVDWLVRQQEIADSIGRDITRLPVWAQYALVGLIFVLFFPWPLIGLLVERRWRKSP
jgi:hypothetical protein